MIVKKHNFLVCLKKWITAQSNESLKKTAQEPQQKSRPIVKIPNKKFKCFGSKYSEILSKMDEKKLFIFCDEKQVHVFIWRLYMFVENIHFFGGGGGSAHFGAQKIICPVEKICLSVTVSSDNEKYLISSLELLC